jgi:hypothetical protein
LALGTFNNLASLVTFSTIATEGDQAGVCGAMSPVECQKWQLELFFKGIQRRRRWQPQISVSAFRTFDNLASFVEQFLVEKKEEKKKVKIAQDSIPQSKNNVRQTCRCATGMCPSLLTILLFTLIT